MSKQKTELRLVADFELGLAKDMERTKGPSQTIPDDSMSVQQLMDRALAGIPVERRAMYFEEEMDHDDVDFSKLKDMDIAEASELLSATKARFETEQKSILDLISERKRQEEDKAILDAGKNKAPSDDLRDENEEREARKKPVKKRPDLSDD